MIYPSTIKAEEMSKNADTGPAMAVVKANREAAPLFRTDEDPVPELALCEISEGFEPSTNELPHSVLRLLVRSVT